MNRILDIIYPPRCLICGKFIKSDLCNKCIKMLEKKEILGIDDYRSNTEKEFDEHMYLYPYEMTIRNLIINYKFKEKPYLYKIFIKNIKNSKKIYLFLKNYDIIIPVPISKKRLKNRGYNQSAIISKEISKEFNINYCDNCLVKIKDTVPQSSLNKEERINNAKNVYRIKEKQKITNKKILLFDDIYTTGTTVNECSKVLKTSGAKKIEILTIAKD